MRKLLKVLALTLAVVLGPRIALADVLAAGRGPVLAAGEEVASEDAGHGGHGLRAAEHSDAGTSSIGGRRPTWAFARRWSPTSRSGPGRLLAMRGFGGLASPGLGEEDGRETRSQRRVLPFRGAKVSGARHSQSVLRSLRPVLSSALFESPAILAYEERVHGHESQSHQRG